MQRRHAWWFGVALVAWLASGCAATVTFTTTDTATVDRLLGLMKERLDLAPEVARIKWNTKAPIEDLPRERQLIDEAARRASEDNLDPDLARAFLRGQIEASKTVQIALYAEWTATKRAPFETLADLEKDIRPVLNRLTPTMLGALAEALPVIQQHGGRELLAAHSHAILGNAPGSAAAVRAAVEPLLRLGR